MLEKYGRLMIFFLLQHDDPIVEDDEDEDDEDEDDDDADGNNYIRC